MAYLLNSLATAASPYVMPVVERNLAPDFVVRFGKSCVYVVSLVVKRFVHVVRTSSSTQHKSIGSYFYTTCPPLVSFSCDGVS